MQTEKVLQELNTTYCELGSLLVLASTPSETTITHAFRARHLKQVQKVAQARPDIVVLHVERIADFVVDSLTAVRSEIMVQACC